MSLLITHFLDGVARLNETLRQALNELGLIRLLLSFYDDNDKLAEVF